MLRFGALVLALSVSSSVPCGQESLEAWSRISNNNYLVTDLSRDGTLVACGEYTIRLFRASDGEFIRTLCSNADQVSKLQFDGAGQYLLVVDSFHTKVVRVADGSVVIDIPGGGGANLSADGSILLVTGSFGGRAYNLPSGTIRYTFSYFLGPIAHSGDFFIGITSNNVSLVQSSTGNLLRNLIPGNYQAITNFGAISQDDTRYAAVTSNSNIVMWDLTQNLDPVTFGLPTPGRLVFLRGDTKLASVEGNNTSVSDTRVYDLETLQLERTLHGGAGPATADGSRFLMRVADYNTTLFSSLTWRPALAQKVRYAYDQFSFADGMVRPIALSGDSGLLAVAYDRLSVYDNRTHQALFRQLPPPGIQYQCLSFSPDGNQVAATHRPTELRNSHTGALLRTFPDQPGRGGNDFGGVMCTEFSPDGQTIAIGGGYIHSDKSSTYYHHCLIQLIRVSDGAVRRTLDGYTRPVTALHFSTVGDSLIGVGGQILKWRVADGTVLREIPAQLAAAAISPNGDWVAGTQGANIFVYNVDSAAQYTFSGSYLYNVNLKFSPGGDKLLEMLYIENQSWEHPEIIVHRVPDGSVIDTYNSEVGSGVLSIAFSESGRTMAYARQDPAFFFSKTPSLFR